MNHKKYIIKVERPNGKAAYLKNVSTMGGLTLTYRPNGARKFRWMDQASSVRSDMARFFETGTVMHIIEWVGA